MTILDLGLIGAGILAVVGTVTLGMWIEIDWESRRSCQVCGEKNNLIQDHGLLRCDRCIENGKSIIAEQRKVA